MIDLYRDHCDERRASFQVLELFLFLLMACGVWKTSAVLASLEWFNRAKKCSEPPESCLLVLFELSTAIRLFRGKIFCLVWTLSQNHRVFRLEGCTFRFLSWFRTWSSPRVGGSLFSQSLPLDSGNWAAWLEHLLVKIEANKLWCTWASSMVAVAIRGGTVSSIFLCCEMYLKKPFLLFFMSLDKFSSSWALAFLIPSLHSPAISL